MRPMVFGGWRNGALSSSLSLDDCMENKDDPARLGIWTETKNRMLTGREKFSAVTVPGNFLKGSDLKC